MREFRRCSIPTAITFLLLGLSISFSGLAADGKFDEKLDTAPVIVDAVELLAVLKPIEGHAATGTVVFKQRLDGKVEVIGRVEGLKAGNHCVLRIHQYGDLSSKNGKSTGASYPEGTGADDAENGGRSAGDLGRLEANSDGVAKLQRVVDGLSLAGRKNPIIGRAVLVYSVDGSGRSAGDAGIAIAVGAIGVRQLKSGTP